jgi:hypothetical protein
MIQIRFGLSDGSAANSVEENTMQQSNGILSLKRFKGGLLGRMRNGMNIRTNLHDHRGVVATASKKGERQGEIRRKFYCQ